jgi:hypothetical protein
MDLECSFKNKRREQDIEYQFLGEGYRSEKRDEGKDDSCEN